MDVFDEGAFAAQAVVASLDFDSRTFGLCILFNVTVIGLSEVRRRSLLYQIESLIIRQEKSRRNETARLEAILVDQKELMADLQLSVGALNVLINDGNPASR